MLREILQENLEGLLLSVQKIGKGFEIIKGRRIEKEDLLEIKRLVHSLKGNLQAIGMHDEAAVAATLEDTVFARIERSDAEGVHIAAEDVDRWFTYLNEIGFSLKSYTF